MDATFEEPRTGTTARLAPRILTGIAGAGALSLLTFGLADASTLSSGQVDTLLHRDQDAGVLTTELDDDDGPGDPDRDSRDPDSESRDLDSDSRDRSVSSVTSQDSPSEDSSSQDSRGAAAPRADHDTSHDRVGPRADSVSRDSVSRDSVSRDSVSRDSVSRDSVSRDSVSRDSGPRADSWSADSWSAESWSASGGSDDS
jgi:hypothetical protein